MALCQVKPKVVDEHGDGIVFFLKFIQLLSRRQDRLQLFGFSQSYYHFDIAIVEPFCHCCSYPASYGEHLLKQYLVLGNDFNASGTLLR